MINKLELSLLNEWPIWILVTEKIATLNELETVWNIDDVERALAILNLKMEIEEMNIKNQVNK
jgi:hypothetical protein